MIYFFDSSSIIEAIKINNFEILRNSYTVEIAKFEIGKVFRDCIAGKKIKTEDNIEFDCGILRNKDKSLEYYKKLIDLIINRYMIIKKIRNKDLSKILKFAIDKGYYFYDALYVYYAKELYEEIKDDNEEVCLITEDNKMYNNINNRKEELGIRAYHLNEILNKN